MDLTVADIRAMVKQLRRRSVKNIKLPLREDICLTVNEVVFLPGCGFMHPETFKSMFGEEAYQELLKRPRVVTSYDVEHKAYLERSKK